MKIASGGQSGVDRAALDTAIALELAYGGWCPKGGWAEDFPEPPGLLAHYPRLEATPSADPAERTRWNVRDSDATLILVDAGGTAVSGGTELAAATAEALGKPGLVLDVGATDALARLRSWLAEVRESEVPGIYAKARRLLEAALRDD